MLLRNGGKETSMPQPKIEIAPERLHAVNEKLDTLKIKNVRLARELRRSPSAITFALRGDRKELFARIERYVQRVEGNRSRQILSSVSHIQDAQPHIESHE